MASTLNSGSTLVVQGAGLFVLGQLGVWPVHLTINVGIVAAVSAAIMAFAARPGAFGRRGRAHRVAPRHGLPGTAPARPGDAGGPGLPSGAVAATAKTPWHASIVTLSPLLLAARGAILIGVWQVATAPARAAAQ